MASEADLSLLTDTFDSIEVSSIQQGSQKERRLRSTIHEYTRKLNDDEPIKDVKGRKIIYYSICSYPGSSTTNIKIHLKLKH